MLTQLFKGAALKKLFGFGARHPALGLGGLLAALAYRNRHRIKGMLESRRHPAHASSSPDGGAG
jgi:hypothetical protein